MIATCALDVRSSLAETSVDRLFAIADRARIPSDVALEIVRHCAWNEPAPPGHPRRIRIGLDGDRVWVGPDLGGERAGCCACLRHRLAENHPRRDDWDALFGAEAPGVALDFPLTPPLARTILSLADALADDAGPSRRYYILDCTNGTIERHAFFPDPECGNCGTRPDDSAALARIELVERLRLSGGAHRLANPALTRRSLRDGFVDHRSGLIKHVFQDLNSHLMPMAGAESVIIAGEPASIGYGRAASAGASETVAILEVLERFANTRPRGKRTSMRARFADLGEQAVDPRLFTLHAPEQALAPGYTLVPYDEELEQNWVWAYSFRRGQPVLMPEQLSYFGVASLPGAPVNRYVQHTSSGCALGGCIEEAILYGLFEIIERDAYMTGWYGRFAYPALDCSQAAEPMIGALLARAHAEGYLVHLFDMTLEARVPSIWAMIEDPRADAPVRSYCAAAAHLDPEKAVVAALVEVISSMSVYRNSMPPHRERARALLADPALVQNMSDHVLLYSQPETMEWLDFLPRHSARIPIRERFADWYRDGAGLDLTSDLDAIVQRLLDVAHDVLVVDQTFAALRPFSLAAAQVSVPGLSPVSFGHQYRRVADCRVRRAAEWLGVEVPRNAAVTAFVPHNFP